MTKGEGQTKIRMLKGKEKKSGRKNRMINKMQSGSVQCTTYVPVGRGGRCPSCRCYPHPR